MAKKINPFSMRPRADVTETKTFTDVDQPGIELVLTLTAKAGADIGGLIGTRIEDNSITYLSGRNGGPPAQISIPGSRRIYISRKLISAVSMLEEMETPEEGEAPYSFEEWCAIAATMPHAFAELTDWAVDLQSRTEGHAGNASADHTD